MRRAVTSCASCLAWGLTYAQGVCLACYNFAAPRHAQLPGECAACHRWERLKHGYCRLCWCQARADRAVLAETARSAVLLAPYLRNIRHYQLFLADLDRRRAKPRTIERRRGAKGRPLKPPPAPVTRPVTGWIQPPLFDAGPRVYRYSRIDLRSGPAPDNPWLAWALHVAHSTGEARGWRPEIRRAIQRVLVMLLANHVEGEQIRVSDFQRILARQSTNLDLVVEILSTMGVVVGDRPAPLESWLDTKIAILAPAIGRDVLQWARVLRDGGPRTRARHPETVRGYVAAVVPALAGWSTRHHLREIVRDDVIAYLATVSGHARQTATSALRSLFGWAKRTNLIFRNPTARISNPHVPDGIWQPLRPDELAEAVAAAITPQARLFLVLAAVHAARPSQIRALHLDDVDLPARRITISGHDRPLDDLTYQVLIGWLEHRRSRWPNTANPHLLVSKETALHHGPVSHALILNLRRLAGNLERLRIDRQLDEAIVTGGDPLHLAAVFGISEGTAIRYATNARILLRGPTEPNR
ncbi:integrase [Dactylosporangium sp. NPDC049140]|uniref:site-specific integrase n=1 Tax=Dactylosporangium sp. NPDC049140 TaxID=3155647 RepID=UPI0033F82176